MSVRSGINFSEFNAFRNSMYTTEEECNAFIKECLIEIGEETVETVASRTPVDTGVLQQSWGLATKWMVPHHTRVWSTKKNRSVDKVIFTRGGGVITRGSGLRMSVIISNPQRYAQIIEDKYGMLSSSLAIMRHRLPSFFGERFEAFKSSKGL